MTRVTLSVGDRNFKEGEFLTIDGSLGQVMAGKMQLKQPDLSGDLGVLMEWVGRVPTVVVLADASSLKDVQLALKLGANGIGVFRSDVMFFKRDCIDFMREFLLAKDEKSRRIAVSRLLPMHRSIFVELFKAIAGFSISIQLLSTSPNNLLPHAEQEIAEIA